MGFWVLLAIVVVAGLWLMMTYNGLVSLRQRVSQAFADIDVQLKQRHDLIPHLVETVKGYAAHERGTLEAVVQARNAAMSARTTGEVAAAENQLSGTRRRCSRRRWDSRGANSSTSARAARSSRPHRR